MDVIVSTTICVGDIVSVETGSGVFELGVSDRLKIYRLVKLQESVNVIKPIKRRLTVFFPKA